MSSYLMLYAVISYATCHFILGYISLYLRLHITLSHATCHYHMLIIIIYPVTTKVVGAPQIILQPVSSIFPCSPLPSGTRWTPGLSIPWCCLPTCSSVCLIFFPLSLCLARWFWQDLMNGRHVHTTDCSLRLFTMVRRSLCGPIAWDFLVGNMVFVRDAQYLALASHFHGLYSSLELCCAGPWFTSIQEDGLTRERISHTLELREILLSFQTGFKLVNTAVVCAILESVSGLEPLSISVITEPRYLKLVTVLSFCPFTLISALKPLVLFVISFVFFQHWSPCCRLWRLCWEQYSVHWFSICHSSVRNFPERTWTVVAFPCCIVVKSFTSWYALLLLFFLRFFSISLHCSPIQFSFAFFMLLLMLLFISLYFSDPSGSDRFFLSSLLLSQKEINIHYRKHFVYWMDTPWNGATNFDSCLFLFETSQVNLSQLHVRTNVMFRLRKDCTESSLVFELESSQASTKVLGSALVLETAWCPIS